jgi:hypothetical protein
VDLYEVHASRTHLGDGRATFLLGPNRAVEVGILVTLQRVPRHHDLGADPNPSLYLFAPADQCIQVAAHVPDPSDPERDQRLEGVRVRIQPREMKVQIPKARDEILPPPVDDLGASRIIDIFADRSDPLAAHDNRHRG